MTEYSDEDKEKIVRLLSQRDALEKELKDSKDELALVHRQLAIEKQNKDGDWRPTGGEETAELYGDHWIDIDRRNGYYYFRTKDGTPVAKGLEGNFTSRRTAKRRFDEFKRFGV